MSELGEPGSGNFQFTFGKKKQQDSDETAEVTAPDVTESIESQSAEMAEPENQKIDIPEEDTSEKISNIDVGQTPKNDLLDQTQPAVTASSRPTGGHSSSIPGAAWAAANGAAGPAINVAAQYKSTNVMTAGKIKSVVLLLEKVRELILPINESNFTEEGEKLRRAKNILAQLEMSLNLKNHESAQAIFEMYELMYEALDRPTGQSLEVARFLVKDLLETLEMAFGGRR